MPDEEDYDDETEEKDEDEVTLAKSIYDELLEDIESEDKGNAQDDGECYP